MQAGGDALRGIRQIDAVSFCIFSSGVIVTDASGKPRTPIITHADRRSSATSLALVRQRSRSWWLRRTGNLPYAGGIASSTLAWLHEHEPGVFRGKYRVGQASTFVTSYLCGGEPLIDPSQAVFLGLWDIQHNRWNAEVCKLVGVATDSLPRVVWADSILGGLSPGLARRWNVSAGTPVMGGFVDTSAAVIQTPMDPGQLAHNAGSTDVLALCVDRAHPAEGILTRPVGVSAWRGHRGREPWLAVRTMASAGSAMEWIGRTLYPTMGSDDLRAMVTAACRRIARGKASETTLSCVATFVGERASLTQPLGASFTGIRLSTTREQLLESVIRALARESAHNYSLLAAIEKPRKAVYVMGGASALGDTMHATWPRHHDFRPLKGDGLRGLVLLAQHTLA
jgi:sugar (pentulose or hexulose) kinase